MLLTKTSFINNIVSNVLNKLVMSTLTNILLSKILPYISASFVHFNTCSFNTIVIYMGIAVAIIFIIYKLHKYFKKKKRKITSYKISTILSSTDEFNLNPRKMEIKKNKKSNSKLSKKIPSTDLLSS